MFELPVWEICKFWILQTITRKTGQGYVFERYVNFEFYKHLLEPLIAKFGLRDM